MPRGDGEGVGRLLITKLFPSVAFVKSNPVGVGVGVGVVAREL